MVLSVSSKGENEGLVEGKSMVNTDRGLVHVCNWARRREGMMYRMRRIKVSNVREMERWKS